MPFKQVFERRMNRNMQESEQGPAPHEATVEEGDIKTHPDSKAAELEEEDLELSEKKERPPRSSTLFTQPAPPQIIERYVEPKRKSGVTLPMPLFVVLAMVLFFESTLLFAYTIIGLYNNVPPGLLPFGPASTAIMDNCNCGDRQPGINISPNFIMPGANADVITVTTAAPTITASSSTTFSTSPTSKTTTTSSLDATAAAAGLVSFLRGQATSSTTDPTIAHTVKVITTTPKQKTVLSTADVTVIAGQSTSTSFVNVPASKSSSNDKRASPASSEGAATSGASKTAAVGGTPTTMETKASPPATTAAPETGKDDGHDAGETTTAGGKTACFGGGGAVALNCVTV